ncbi:hypothetical protein [Ruania rhizosphaerae]|uniref:hypothetical protein n=1 Tax=Ruania rhizosphaerae TaxID=1840413 RepID=UPI00135B0832|nr:hypothetical protein [Ruania rhizosphaerae]
MVASSVLWIALLALGAVVVLSATVVTVILLARNRATTDRRQHDRPPGAGSQPS